VDQQQRLACAGAVVAEGFAVDVDDGHGNGSEKRAAGFSIVILSYNHTFKLDDHGAKR
jgi:hypothetical protein